MENLNQYIDIHKGKMAFVLGSGPSLRNLNPDLLKPHITIAVNEAILKVPFAEYFVCCDWGMPLYKAWLTVKKSRCKLILHNVDVGFSYLDNQTGVKAFDNISSERISYFDFKNDFDIIMDKESGRLIRGSSSVHSAVHFALLLGCSPIVLLGCDCRYVEDKKHFTDFPNQPAGGRIKPEYYNLTPDWSGVKKNDTDGELNIHYNTWQKIRKNNPNINIINASGGRLDMFPRMALEEVIKKLRKERNCSECSGKMKAYYKCRSYLGH